MTELKFLKKEGFYSSFFSPPTLICSTQVYGRQSGLLRYLTFRELERREVGGVYILCITPNLWLSYVLARPGLVHELVVIVNNTMTQRENRRTGKRCPRDFRTFFLGLTEEWRHRGPESCLTRESFTPGNPQKKKSNVNTSLEVVVTFTVYGFLISGT